MFIGKKSSRLISFSSSQYCVHRVFFLYTGSFESYKRYVAFGDADSMTKPDDSEPPMDVMTGGQQSWMNYFNEKLDKKTTWLVFTVVSATALVVLLLIIIFLRKRIRLSIALIVEGSR